ncbi:HD domain-containing protein [Panacibacter ginsenosidivorans]|uniref:HD domain-containing protein n=1 Tax=Panacibacter ginsenosidivorans TaxID=1813871 RepID=A0A5B8VB40_9BACT|nr:HD domain-containing protein [Panacibacter ginsenosidivorans]QEC68707.1 HD domain-containing protein [Panacibacter ginsenosidivorans]
MQIPKRKIINDPVHGFITIEHPLIFSIIAHPYYQRLRRIHQMALAQLVYPGAVHTRLHHSLGAYHLMCLAINELKSKGAVITPDEEVAAKAAILLHDIGHGPFSHALENILLPGISHEELSLQIMHVLNKELNGKLDLAIQLFTGKYHKLFLHQLISSQLDVDRMDYLTRDSFFTGVSEGIIGYDRLLKMFIGYNNQLMIEEKGIYSVEKFLVARRQMYWQVYLHKTVLAAEKMLVKIITRAREIKANSFSPYLNEFLHKEHSKETVYQLLFEFCQLDDYDIIGSIKIWATENDRVLSTLCKNLLKRDLLKCKLQTQRFDEELIQTKKKSVMQQLGLTFEEAGYFVFTGEAINTTYKLEDEHINILFKNESVKDISKVDNPLIHQTLSVPVKKFYICYLNV